MAVNVMRWLGRRIDLVRAIEPDMFIEKPRPIEQGALEL